MELLYNAIPALSKLPTIFSEPDKTDKKTIQNENKLVRFYLSNKI